MTMVALTGSVPVESFDGLATGMRAFGAVGLVLALLLVLAWLVRRGTLRFPGAGAAAPIRIEAATSLGERRSLVVVAVEGRRLLLGITPVQVSFVTELGSQAPAFGAALDARLSTPPPTEPS